MWWGGDEWWCDEWWWGGDEWWWGDDEWWWGDDEEWWGDDEWWWDDDEWWWDECPTCCFLSLSCKSSYNFLESSVSKFMLCSNAFLSTSPSANKSMACL